MTLSRVNEIIYKYEASGSDKLTLIGAADAGLNAESFFELAEISGIDKDDLAGFLNLSLKTFTRHARDKKRLNPLNSEQILKMFTLYRKGQEIFGGIDSFNRWLRKPAIGLGNLVPYKLLSTISGIDLIYQELLAIEYGDFS